MAELPSFQSMDFEQIKKDLIEYVQSKAEFESWLDFFDGSAGTTLIELMAGLGTFLSFHSTMSRQESHLHTAKLKSSIYNMADLLGYPPNRKTSAIFSLTIAVTESVFWDRSIPIGDINGISLSLDSSQTLVVGNNTVTVYAGEWKNYQETVRATVNFKEITLLTADSTIIDNDFFEVKVDAETIEYTNYIEELESYDSGDSTRKVALMKTLSDRILLVFGDGGEFGRMLSNSEVVNIDYFEVQEIVDYALASINLEVGILDTGNSSVVRLFSAEDSLKKISTLAPAYSSARRRMVTKGDHEAIIASYPGLVSVKADKITTECCTLNVAYLYSDEHVMTASEESLLRIFLENFRIQGELLKFLEAQVVQVTVDLTIVIEEGADTTAIQSAVEARIDESMLKLGETFHVGNIVTLVTDLTGVIRVYLVTPRFDKALSFNKYFKRSAVSLTFTTDRDIALQFGDTSEGYLE